jgi:hypothetical protein
VRHGFVALVFRGESGALLNPRLEPMALAMAEAGLRVTPVPFGEGHESGLQQQLTNVDGVLVWADPLGDDGDRTALDEALRAAERAGVWVSARPDVIDRLGTKEVLVTTRDLGWGSDARLYPEPGVFRREFPTRLAATGVRVLKASRGNGGRTVWKVRLPGGRAATAIHPDTDVVVQHARVRDWTATSMTLHAAMDVIEAAGVFDGWDGTGSLVEQEFLPGIARGIIRCYLVGGAVAGFARQYPHGVIPDGPLRVIPESEPSVEQVMGLPSPKTMYPPEEPAFVDLRARLEGEWVPGMAGVLGLETHDLPALWDVDLIGEGLAATDQESAGSGALSRFVLCEINASSVIPFPPQAPARVAQHVVAALSSR